MEEIPVYDQRKSKLDAVSKCSLEYLINFNETKVEYFARVNGNLDHKSTEGQKTILTKMMKQIKAEDDGIIQPSWHPDDLYDDFIRKERERRVRMDIARSVINQFDGIKIEKLICH